MALRRVSRPTVEQAGYSVEAAAAACREAVQCDDLVRLLVAVVRLEWAAQVLAAAAQVAGAR